ncbi:MAG: hypothetical protein ABFS02_09415 [Pseudomonadota bacterium]
MNKVFFWMAVFFTIIVFLWPSLSVVSKEYGKDIKLLSSAIVQTTVTGVAALMFALYSHYKEMQMSTENLMRYVVYTKNKDIEAIAEKVIKEMEKIDAGFSFSWVSEDKQSECTD